MTIHSMDNQVGGQNGSNSMASVQPGNCEKLKVSNELHGKLAALIQGWWRTIISQKWTKSLQDLAYLESCEDQTFEQLSKIIRTARLINSACRVLSFIEHKTRDLFLSRIAMNSSNSLTAAPHSFSAGQHTLVKIFLSAFLIKKYPKNVLSPMGEKSKLFFESSLKMVDAYQQLRPLLSSYCMRQYRFCGIKDKQLFANKILPFNQCWKEYVEQFLQWKVDHKREVEFAFIERYVKIEEDKIFILQSNCRKKGEKLKELIIHQHNIFNELYFFSGNEALDTLYGRLETLNETRERKRDILFDQSISQLYKIISNPNFRFVNQNSNPLADHVVNQIRDSCRKSAPNIEIIVASLLEIRKRLIELASYDPIFTKGLREEFNALSLKEKVLQFSNRVVFEQSFLYIVKILQILEIPERQIETSLWAVSVLQELAREGNPWMILPEIFKELYKKLDQISVDHKNLEFQRHREHWRSQAVRKVIRMFNKRLIDKEVHLSKTKQWVKVIIQRGNLLGFTKEMIVSKYGPAHLLSTAWIAYLRSSMNIERRQTPETLLTERIIFNRNQNKLNAIAFHATFLEIFRYAVHEAGGVVFSEDLKRLHEFLSMLLRDQQTKGWMLSQAVGFSVFIALQNQGKDFSGEKQKIVENLVLSSFSSNHRIFKIVSDRILFGVEFFFYQKKLPETMINHPIYRLFPELEEICHEFVNLALFNLSIHYDRYYALIKENQYGDLFKLLKRSCLLEIQVYPVLLKNESKTIKNIHNEIVKLTLIATYLTNIRHFIWLNSEGVVQRTGQILRTHSLSDESMLSLIEKYKIRELFLSDETTASSICMRMISILDQELQAQSCENEEGKKSSKKIFNKILTLKTAGYRLLHASVVDSLRGDVQSEKGKKMEPHNILKFFQVEIHVLGDRLQKCVEKARSEAEAQIRESEHVPFVSGTFI